MSQQVGFTFQGDVFLGTSLAISATGRLMKLLSDAGVDMYAVAAVLELGRRVPISQHQEMVVSTAMLKRRNSRAGYLAQFLRIGWGCNDTAYELSRTREGSAAPMLADAFAAGQSYYLAAQALQDLISLSGCHREFLPSVTVLKGLISHVAPIMEDSGFRATLEHIRVTSIIALRRLYPPLVAESRLAHVSDDYSSPKEWAGVVKQLMLVASQGETAHLVTNMRGAWLAAFAVHVLSMECSLLHQSSVLWHAAGSQGSVTIQLATELAPPIRSFWCSLVLQVDSPSHELPIRLETFYPLKDALQTELSSIPGLTLDFHNVIRRRIVRIVLRLIEIAQVKTDGCWSTAAPMTNKAFGRRDLVGSILQDLGIHLDLLHVEDTIDDDVTKDMEVPWEVLAACPCGRHLYQRGLDEVECVKDFLFKLVQGVAATVMALRLCVADASHTQVSAAIFNGTAMTAWSVYLFHLLQPDVTSVSKPADLNMLLGHLRRLVHGESASETQLPAFCLGVSAKGATIAFKALFDEEAFTEDGQVLAIYPGRVTAENEFREFIGNEAGNDPNGQRVVESWSIAAGITFSPPCADGLAEISCGFEMAENRFNVACYVLPSSTEIVHRERGLAPKPKRLIYCVIRRAVINLLRSQVGHCCSHARERPFVVPASRDSIRLRTAH